MDFSALSNAQKGVIGEVFGANTVERALPAGAERLARLPNGTAGSVKPDYCIGTVCSVEVKNYNIANNADGLISNVSQQAIDRAIHLPSGMTQNVVIDIRGQLVLDAQKNAIIEGIVTKSRGAISPDAIEFMEH